eukprot:scaffold205523_cov34-Tisochrysis_lutea.AAC.1
MRTTYAVSATFGGVALVEPARQLCNCARLGRGPPWYMANAARSTVAPISVAMRQALRRGGEREGRERKGREREGRETERGEREEGEREGGRERGAGAGSYSVVRRSRESDM